MTWTAYKCRDFFYEVEEDELSVKGLRLGTDKPFVAYKYTKLGNTFLCCNPNCDKAVQMVPNEANLFDSNTTEDWEVIVLISSSVDHHIQCCLLANTSMQLSALSVVGSCQAALLAWRACAPDGYKQTITLSSSMMDAFPTT
jgi:hypothetical protein